MISNSDSINDNSSIKVVGLTKYFGYNRILENLEFSIDSGKIYSLIAPNGFGKTTLMKMLGGVISPNEGSIVYNEKKISFYKFSSFNDKIVFVTTTSDFFSAELTVWENIEIFYCFKFGKKIVRNFFINSIFPYFFFPENNLESDFSLNCDYNTFINLVISRLDMKVSELSSGWSSFFNYLVWSINDPSVLIMDEPFANLDYMIKNFIFLSLIKRKKRNKSSIFSTHDFSDCKICDKFFLLRSQDRPSKIIVLDNSLKEFNDISILMKDCF